LPQRAYPLGQAEAFVVDNMTETLKAATSSAMMRILDMTSPFMERRLTGQAVEFIGRFTSQRRRGSPVVET